MAKRDADSITRSQPFTAKVVKSKIDNSASLVMGSKRWFQHNLNKFRDGEIVTLEIHSRKPKRTAQQNRYYWGVYLPIIAKETGENDLDALHELFKGKFLSEGIIEVLGEKVRKKKSTTDLGVGEFCQYILDIEALTGIEAPPTENWELAPLREGIKNNDHDKSDSEAPGGAGKDGDTRGSDSEDRGVDGQAPKKRAKRASNNRPRVRRPKAEGESSGHQSGV